MEEKISAEQMLDDIFDIMQRLYTGTTQIVISDKTGLVGQALAENRTVLTNDPYNHPNFNAEVDKKTGYVTKSVLVMPVSNCRG